MFTLSKHGAQDKHPVGLWYLSLVIMLYCYSFSTISSLLVLYSTQVLHIPVHKAYKVFAAYNSLLFTLPLAGGWIAGRFGYRNVLFTGLVFCTLAMVFISFPSTSMMYLGLATFAVGVGMASPASYCLVGLLYDKQDPRRESGFTLFYMIFNIGFMLAAIAGGYLSRDLGYQFAFWVAGAVIILGLVVYAATSPLVKPFKGRSMDATTGHGIKRTIASIAIAGLIGVPIAMLLLENVQYDNALLWVLIIGAVVGLIVLAAKQKEAIQRYRLIAFMLLSVVSITFWALYMLEPSLLTVFIADNVDKTLFGIFHVPPSAFYGLDPFYIIIFGLVFSWMWRYLAKHNKDLSLPTKFALALVCMALGFLIFAMGIKAVGASHLVNAWWIIVGYLFLTVGELLISPIGFSMVGRLSPAGKEGILMGVWQLFTGFSAIISGYLADMTVTPKGGTPATTNIIYYHSYVKIGVATLIVSVVAFLLVPTIKRLVARKDNHSAASQATNPSAV